MLLSRTVCKPLPMDLPGIPDRAGARPGGRSPRRRTAVAEIVAGLSALVTVVVGCGRLHPASTPDERAAAAVVDSCRGVADGALCNDQNTCTVGDRCAGGLCVGTLAPDGTACTDNNQCTVTDLCLQGVCKGTAVAEGTLCTDGDPCTEPDVCHLGQCTSGGPNSCDDGDPCTMDRCLETEGCRHDPILTCSDAAMTGDGAAGDADGGGLSDGADADAADVDAAATDGADAADAEPDAGSDDGADGPIDGAPADGPDVDVDGSAADAVADGSDADSGFEAGEAGGGDGGTVDIARIYEARGGACVCSSGPGGPPSGASVLIVVLALTLLRVRGRRPRTHP